jgi:hypothetical protein
MHIKLHAAISYLLLSLLLQPVWAASAALQFDSGPRPVALLEMFSSQGCSSCPAAERWMSTLKQDPRLWRQLVPVVFHVDYWDYLGWRDPFASMKHSQRQRRYHLHQRCKAVYTPGFMLAGSEWRDWFNRRELPTDLPGHLSNQVPKAAFGFSTASTATSDVGRLKIEVENGQYSARFIRNADNRGLVFNIALLGFDQVTDIGAGENRGRRLPQDFVVLVHHTETADKPMWKGSLPASPLPGKKAVAFWVSHGNDPAPLQATGGWLPE